MTQLHVHEVFWNIESNDSTNNIEMSISHSYNNYISILTIFSILSSIFITNIRKRKNLIIHSKFQMIEFRQNNKLDISNRYFSQVHKQNMNQFVQIRNFCHRFHFVNFIAKFDISNRISSQHIHKKEKKRNLIMIIIFTITSLCTLILCNLVKSMKKRKLA